MTLLECLHNALFVHNCNHGEEAGVIDALEMWILLNHQVTNVSINH